jgi:nucleotide-binding universal stress UspA family protein
MPFLQRVSVSIKNILWASDLSSASDGAASYAKGLALNFRSAVEIAHVFDPSVVTAYMEAILGLPVKEKHHLSNQSLERLERDFIDAGIEATTSYPESHRPHTALLQLAQEHDIDLIVAGTHSKWGLERLIVGSTAEELIRNATCPVLTVGPHARQPQDGPLVFRTIVYATDFRRKPLKPRFSHSHSPRTAAHAFTSVTSQIPWPHPRNASPSMPHSKPH